MEKILSPAGSVLGGTLLVAGCCIGAGMLGMPVLSAMAGFYPSIFIFLAGWLFMLTTGLLLIEVNLWYGAEVSLVTLAEKTLGRTGKIVCWFVFLYLFYSLMVAYVAASGALVSDFAEQIVGITLPHAVGGAFFSLLFAFLIYYGTGAIDWFNRLLMMGLMASYGCLVGMGLPHIEPHLLEHRDWSYAGLAIPTVIVSFGFHNLIPSLTTYFKGRVKPLVSSVIFGSVLALAIYLIWDALILGLVPLVDFRQAMDHGEIATEALKNAIGASWIVNVAQLFAFFAIVTSFLGVALSFVDFLADGLTIEKTNKGKILLVCLVLGPPFICALLYPSIFLMALQYAGGFGAVTLFGILPALMVWQGRYRLGLQSTRLVPGGRLTLTCVILFALAIMALQIF